MLTHYKEIKERVTWYVAEWKAPALVVVLDFDAPCGKNPDWYTARLRQKMVEGVTKLADELSERYGLGRWWAYDTGSPGVHVIFENRAHSPMRWSDIMNDIAHRRKGWKECGGHYLQVQARGPVLRVGHKPGRDWDIVPWPSNPTDKPPHVQEHDELLAMRLPASGR